MIIKMRVSPINTVNNTKFGAIIKPTQSLNESFDKIGQCIESGRMKDLDYAKDFIDNIARISESKKITDFAIDIDKRRPEHTYVKINGRRYSGGHNEMMPNVVDSYLIIEGTKSYASKLEKLEPSSLDFLKAQLEEAQNKLDELKERYGERLKAEFEQAKRLIFDAK